MSLEGLLAATTADPALVTAIEAAGAPSLTISGPAALQPFAMAALAGRAGRVVLAVTSTGREADDLVAALQCLLPPDTVALYPGWETLPHERLSPARGHRGPAAGRAAPAGPPVRPTTRPAGPLSVVVAPVRSVLQPQVPGSAS